MIKDITVQVGGKFPHPAKQYTSIQASVSMTCELTEREQSKKVLEARIQDLRTMCLDELRKSFKMQLEGTKGLRRDIKKEPEKPIKEPIREPGEEDSL